MTNFVDEFPTRGPWWLRPELHGDDIIDGTDFQARTLAVHLVREDDVRWWRDEIRYGGQTRYTNVLLTL